MKKLIKQLKAYNLQEAGGSIFGFGCLRAKDYDKNRLGHLFLFSLNIGTLKFIKKLFVKI